MILPLKLSLYLKVFAARDAKWRIWRHINFGTFAFVARRADARRCAVFGSVFADWIFRHGQYLFITPADASLAIRFRSDCKSGSVVAQKQIYLPLASGVIVSLSSVDGALFWKSEIGGEVSAVPSADERGVYLASATAETAPQNSSSRDSSSGVLRALGRESGVTLWRRTLSSPIQGALAATQTTIYGGARDGHLYAVQKNTGEILWAKQFPAAFNSCPLADGSRLYIGAEDGTLRRSIKTGDTLWRYRTHGRCAAIPYC
jgi:outer membrane protein assembly factor BamB